jgi:hypothetical protein
VDDCQLTDLTKLENAKFFLSPIMDDRQRTYLPNLKLTTLEPATSIIPSGAQYVTCTLKLDEEKSEHAGLAQQNGYKLRGWSTTHKCILGIYYTLVGAKKPQRARNVRDVARVEFCRQIWIALAGNLSRQSLWKVRSRRRV